MILLLELADFATMRNNIPPLSLPFICSILLGLCTLVFSGECLGTQQSLLLQLKSSLAFSNDSTKLVTWNKSSDCCFWDGITCEEGHVTHLNLSNEGIHSRLDNSSTLFNLQHLKNLDLSYNYFKSTIPSRIGDLANLSHLNLGCAGFGGQIPIGMSRLKSLVALDLSSGCWSNRTNLVIPNLKMLVQNLSKLQELRLGGANISTPRNGWCQALSSSLPNLRVLSLSYSYVPGPLDQSLVELQSLSAIHLEGTNLSSAVPQSFEKFSNLTLLNLRNCGLQGTFPRGIFQVPSLQIIDVSSNEFLQGTLPEFQINHSLQELNLSSTKFSGRLPTYLGNLRNLSRLDLSMCQFNGILPSSMANLTQVYYLDLSSNNFIGQVPSNLSANLELLNLSHNHLVGMQKPFIFPEFLLLIDVHFNQIQGKIPTLPKFLHYLDLSSNNFTSLPDNFAGITYINFVSLSNNSLTGNIPESMCDSVHRLGALDLSDNNLSGKIPPCVFETSGLREILNLRKNNFEGPIPDVFPRDCKLKALDLSRNFIEGEIPKSLAHCSGLEILDLGHNELIGEFPCLLKNISTLHVLILRGNKLFGGIECPNADGSWPVLQILDLADNNFSGKLPRRWLTKLQGMMDGIHDGHLKVLRLDDGFLDYAVLYFHYIFTATVTSKGLEMELPKILDIFTCIDLSKNNFHGEITAELGQLQALYSLNLSYNALTGQIPSSIGNLRNMESLDLSWNNLSGTIPTQLQSLSFLSFLNLSYNQLVGMIPTGKQFQTFSEDSFIGNKGLCGFPLTKNCSDKAAGTFPSTTTKDDRSDTGRKIDWNLLSAEIGLLTGFAVVVSPLVFSPRWRIRYYERVDDIIINIFPLTVSRKWFLWTNP